VATPPADTGERALKSELHGPWLWAFQACAVALGIFSLWAAGPGIPEEHFQYAVYLGLTWIMVLLKYPERRAGHWQPPGLLDWTAGLLLAGSAIGAIMRAEQVAEGGANTIDWVLWIVGGLSFAVVAFLPRARTLALIVMSIMVFTFYETQFNDLIQRPGAWNATDFWLASVAVVMSIEVARRAIGLSIPLLVVVGLLYAHYGRYFPGPLAHRGSSVEQIANYLMYSQEGIFGIMTSVMANTVIVFIYLGAFMERSGMGKFFIELPLAVAGRTVGGPAKVAVIASAVFGSINGASLANIVATGAFTIPLMKRVGFRPHVAGAVENSASVGGQLLPPIMGSGVFIMAEITGIPYLEIIAVAAAPALLYMLSIGFMVHFDARRSGIRGMQRGEVDSPLNVLRRGWYHLVPFAVLLGLLIVGYSPVWSASLTIVSILVINWIRIVLARLWPDVFGAPDYALGIRGIKDALVLGSTNSLVVGAVAAAVGVLMGVIVLTGLPLKVGNMIVNLADGQLLIALFLVGVASLVLGMALPITVSYLLLIVLAGPALLDMGVALIAAHMIVFWLSQDSNITPPVCLGAYVAASIAVADPWKTGWTSFRFAKMLYVIPLLFAYTPMLTGSVEEIAWVLLTATAGTYAFSGWSMGWLKRRTTFFEWIVLGAIALMCFLPAAMELPAGTTGWQANIAGMILLAGFYLWQRARPDEPGRAVTASG